MRIKNITKYNGKNSIAKNVFAKLTFHHLTKDEVLLSDVYGSSIYGRWAESLEPPQVLDKESLKYMDILPEDEKTLDLATRYLIHNDWYAVSTESYTADQFENTALLVHEKDFRIKVEINGKNVRETHWFVVYNQGTQGKPQIFELKDKK